MLTIWCWFWHFWFLALYRIIHVFRVEGEFAVGTRVDESIFDVYRKDQPPNTLDTIGNVCPQGGICGLSEDVCKCVDPPYPKYPLLFPACSSSVTLVNTKKVI